MNKQIGHMCFNKYSQAGDLSDMTCFNEPYKSISLALTYISIKIH